MYMSFEGVLGTGNGWVRGVLGLLAEDSDVADGGVRFGVGFCAAIRLIPSGTALETGGGNGEMEMLETEAVWAL